MIKPTRKIILTISLCALSAGATFGQTGAPFNQRDDQYRLLGLKRARDAYEVARAEFGRQKELFDRGLINKAELERAQSSFSGAEVDYQQSLLAVLFEQQYVSVTDAVKYRGSDGSKRVRLTLANTSGGTAEFKHLLSMEDELFQSLKPDVVHNVYVSLLNQDGAIISQPYETKIEELRYGEPQTLEFNMLQDLDAVTVYLIFSNGSERNFKIFLQKDATVNRVVVQSEQFSQEVDLGESATFDLTLELFSGSSDTYSLQVVNLPQEIPRYFTDPAGRVRLTQVKFSESTQSKRAALRITLPERPTDAVTMDSSIEFFALIIPRETIDEIPDLKSRHWTKTEIEALNIGFVRLEMSPRGRGELMVRTPLLFQSITPGQTVSLDVELYNEGSRRIDNVTFETDLPLHWSKTLQPHIVPTIEIGQDKRVTLTLFPPENISEGRYDVRLRSAGMSNNQTVGGEDKTFTIEVRSETNVLGASLIVTLLIGLVGGIVVFGVRLSRK
ncbi:MAG: NEW3 domain-containing protein [Candidatus Zixiibacteriota bacterium]